MSRQLERMQMSITPIESVDAAFEADPQAWMTKQAQPHGFRYLLTYGDDGVIWGCFNAAGLQLSSAAFSEVTVPLSAQTLQVARLFGAKAELLIWKRDGGWAARLIEDGAGADIESYSEKYWLWGTKDKEDPVGGFTLLREGKQGLLHAPPISGLGETDRVALCVRHYIDYDGEGQAYVSLSRLVGVERIPNGG